MCKASALNRVLVAITPLVISMGSVTQKKLPNNLDLPARLVWKYVWDLCLSIRRNAAHINIADVHVCVTLLQSDPVIPEKDMTGSKI